MWVLWIEEMILYKVIYKMHGKPTVQTRTV